MVDVYCVRRRLLIGLHPVTGTRSKTDGRISEHAFDFFVRARYLLTKFSGALGASGGRKSIYSVRNVQRACNCIYLKLLCLNVRGTGTDGPSDGFTTVGIFVAFSYSAKRI